MVSAFRPGSVFRVPSSGSRLLGGARPPSSDVLLLGGARRGSDFPAHRRCTASGVRLPVSELRVSGSSEVDGLRVPSSGFRVAADTHTRGRIGGRTDDHSELRRSTFVGCWGEGVLVNRPFLPLALYDGTVRFVSSKREVTQDARALPGGIRDVRRKRK